MGRLTFRLNEKQEEDMRTKYLHFKYFPIPDYDLDRGNPGRITNDMLYNKLGELEDIEEELGISIIDFYKILKVRHIWAEIGLDLTNIFDELVLFDIKGFDVELNRILLKENKYNLRSIPFNMYKICFWLSRDKSE